MCYTDFSVQNAEKNHLDVVNTFQIHQFEYFIFIFLAHSIRLMLHVILLFVS